MKNIAMQRPKSRILSDRLTAREALSGGVGHEKSARGAVFLDRDGTLNVERGYILQPADIELIPTAGESVRTLNDLDIPVIIITNQAAIAKNLLSPEQLERVNEKLWTELSAAGAYYDALYYCPHSPEVTPECQCRKPKPGLILQAARDFNIDLSASFMIGDKLSDIGAGRSAGCKTILLLSNGGKDVYQGAEAASPDFTCRNVGEAIAWLLPRIQSG